MYETSITANFEGLTLEDVGDTPVGESVSPKAGGDMAPKRQLELLNLIENVGYTGSLLSENELIDALENGPKNVEYTRLINYLTTELRELCSLDECVNPIATPEDSVTFLMELSSFLKELGCPHSHLMQGHVSERLISVDDRILLLQHLISELMAARILRENRPEKRIDLKLRESSQASDMRKILQILGFPKPPPNITMHGLFQKITPTIQNLIQKAHKDLVGNPIFNGTLSDKQWEILENIDQDLNKEYLIRREMLLKRLDCTIQSFQWSDKTKGKDALFEKTYTEKRKCLKVEPEVNISDLLAARDDLAVIEKTSSALVRKNTKSSINRVIIGEVPDRGGRTSEQEPPPPEMPPWQQRSAGASGGQFSRGGFNNSRGGGNNYGDSRGGRGNTYGDSRGGRGNNYGDSRGGGRGNSYSSFDSAGSYSGRGDSQRGNNYSRGNNDYSRGGNNYVGGGNDYNSSYSRNDNYNQSGSGYSQSSIGYSQSNRGRGGGFDSAGSYGGYTQDYQEPKRAKTYDEFQQSRNTYADQYVQESQQNLQYQSRDRDNRNRGNRGGRSNYNRGGGSYR